MTLRTAGRGSTGAGRPTARVLFLISFSALFLIAIGYSLSRLPSLRRQAHPPPAGKAANERLAVLAIEGLLFEAGASPVAESSPPGRERGRLAFRIDPALRAEPLAEKLAAILSPLGYLVALQAPTGRGEAEEITLTARRRAPTPGEGDLTIVLLRRPLPPASTESAPRHSRPLAAIVIDDLGLSRDIAERAAGIPAPVTLAIMPMQPASEEAARVASRHGKELLLHLPMEPLEYPEKDPGPGALLTGMTSEEMRRVLREDLRTVPGAVGVNNHMGSRLTTDRDAMDVLMGLLGSSRLYLLDSRTSANSSAYQSARSHGIKAVRRDVFLDNVDEPDAITSQIDELIRLALAQGEAVGIGHPRENTLAALAQNLDRFKKAGVDVVPLSRLAR